MMINGVNAFNTAHAYNAVIKDSSTSSATSSPPDNGIKASDFMTLLVAEIQNQDPTQPMDPTTFMSQLVQLNQLEQVTQINQVVQQYANSTATSGTTPTTH